MLLIADQLLIDNRGISRFREDAPKTRRVRVISDEAEGQ